MSDLYAGEDIGIWDADTGQILKETFEDKQEAEAAILIEQSELLTSMKKSPGWDLLNKYLIVCIDSHKEKLAYSTDFEQVRRLQEATKAYKNVLAFVDRKIHECLSFKNQKAPPGEG